MNFILRPGNLSLDDIRILLNEDTRIELDEKSLKKITSAEKFISEIIKKDKVVYGVNTGFGALANTRIASSDLEKLQTKIILSHAAGTGEYVSDHVSRLMLALKVNSLARGYSGVKLSTINALIELFNAKMYPCIPSQGSVGASGDLAPLAHMSAVLLGIGEVRHQQKIIPAIEALKKINLAPIKFSPKEGLSLLNGTQFSTALGLLALLSFENLFVSAIVSGALAVEAARASDTPFDARIHHVSGHTSQIKVASYFRDLFASSEIRASHLDCPKVQDPYSLRCQPQVMGAVLSQIEYAHRQLITEANGISDNPIIFVEQKEVLSGGNFHAQAIAFAADQLALGIAELGSLAERRIALLMDPHFSNLPAFLVNNSGLNSGFMLAHVTAAALVSENKALAHPSSVDSLPTSANQEDHVSMAAYATRRLHTMLENGEVIISIELLAATQGIDFLYPLKTSPSLSKIHALIRKNVPFLEEDRFMAPDVASIKRIIQSEAIKTSTNISIFKP